MSVNQRPLAAALGVALVAAVSGGVVAVSKHHAAARPPITGAAVADAHAAKTPWSGGLETMVPDAPESATPFPQQPIPAAKGVDLLWRTMPGDDQMLEAVDWTGLVRGRLALPAKRDNLGAITPSPDGQRLLIEQNSGYQVYSAQGGPLGSLQGDQLSWADDSVHLCNLTTAWGDHGGTAKLAYVTLGARDRSVTSMAWEGGGGVGLVACSASHDLAVLRLVQGDDAAGHVVEYRVVHLSTGAVIRDVRPSEPDFRGNEPRATPGSLDSVSASLDGSLLALNPYTGDPRMANAPPAQIVDTVSGRTLGHAPGPVEGFSGDDSLVLTYPGVIAWRTGHVVWKPRYEGGGGTIRPGSAEIVVTDVPNAPTPTATDNYGAQVNGPPVYDYLILHPDGSTIRLACCGVTVF